MIKDLVFVEGINLVNVDIILFLKRQIAGKFKIGESVVESNDLSFWERAWNKKLGCYIIGLGFLYDENIVDNVRQLKNIVYVNSIGDNINKISYKKLFIEKFESPIRKYMLGACNYCEYD